MENSQFLKRFSWVGSLQLLSMFLGLATSIVIGRTWGEAGLGAFGLGLSVVALAGSIGSFGAGTGLVRFVAGANPLRAMKLLKKAFGAIFLWSSLVAFVSYPLLSRSFPDHVLIKDDLFVRFFSMSIPISVSFGLMGSFLVGSDRVAHAQSLSVFNKALFFCFSLLALWLTLEIQWLALSYLLALSLVLLLGMLWIYQTFKKTNHQPVQEETNCDLSLIKLISYSAPLLIVSLSSILLAQLDRLMVIHFSGLEEAGLYIAAADPSLKLNLILALMTTIFLPRIVVLMKEQNIFQLNLENARITGFIIILTSVVLFVLLIWSHEFMSLYGESFQSGVLVLQVLACGQMINVVTGPVGKILELGGHQYWSLVASMATLVINFSLNCLLIPQFGSLGAAAATCAALMVAHGGLSFLVFRKMRITSFDRTNTKIVLLTLVFASFSLLLGNSHFSSSVKVVGSCALLVSYLSLVLLCCLSSAQRMEALGQLRGLNVFVKS